MSDVLKNCPFCGAQDCKLIIEKWGCWVECSNCAAASHTLPTEKETVTAWNTRHQPLEPMYYPSEQMQQVNVICERYTKQSLKYKKLLAFVKEIATWNARDNYYYDQAKELLKEIGEDQ